MDLFNCQVSYQLEEDSKKRTEDYLVNALTYTEAEVKIIEKATELSENGEFEIKGIKPQKYNELFLDNKGEIYYAVKIVFYSVEGKEYNHWDLIKGEEDSIDKIYTYAKEKLKDSVDEFRIHTIQETSFKGTINL